MRFIVLILLSTILTSCLDHGNRPISNKKALAEIIPGIETYLKEQLNQPVRSIDSNGMISITDGISVFKINHEKIVTGEIDENRSIDAIVPVYYFRGNALMEYRHYILIFSEDKYEVVKTLNDVFNIIEIRNNKIAAEVSTVAADSPGFGCAECREVIQYQYINNDLVKIK